MLYILAALVFILFIADYLINQNERALAIRRIPGFKWHFLLGNTPEVINIPPVELFQLGRNLASKFKGIYSFYSLYLAAVNIYNPDDIEIIISNMKHHEKSAIYTLLRPWLRDGLLLSSGQKWRERRKILTSAFHFNVLRQYFIIFKENSQRLIETLDRTSGFPTNIVPLMSEFTLNSICESAMGTQLNEEGAGKAYKQAIHDIIQVMYNRFIKIYLYPDFTYYLTKYGKLQSKYLSIMHNFTEKIIKQRKEAINNNEVEIIKFDDDVDDVYHTSKKKKAAMLDLLISAQNDGSIDEIGIQEEVDTFTFEGHDTSSSGLTFFHFCMANNPEIQEKIVSELRDIFNDTQRETTIEDLNKMQYLELCIKESLRLYPPVPFISRRVCETVTLSNYTVPKGVFCHIHIYDLHRNPELYENPLEFNPDRFLPENSVGRHNFAYIPFSAGPRNCIGQKFAIMEMKTALSAILRNFRLEKVTTPSDLVFKADLILRNSKPIYVKFVRRKERL